MGYLPVDVIFLTFVSRVFTKKTLISLQIYQIIFRFLRHRVEIRVFFSSL